MFIARMSITQYLCPLGSEIRILPQKETWVLLHLLHHNSRCLRDSSSRRGAGKGDDEAVDNYVTI